MKYVVLLRGINVGGNNIIAKDDLKKCFEKCGFERVLTYIQSGNILFSTPEKKKASLQRAIQTALQSKMGKEIPVVVFSEEEYREAVEAAHAEWGQNSEQKHNALFFLNEEAKEHAAPLMEKSKSEYETLTVAPAALFWSVSKEHYGKSSYTQHLIKSPLYKQVTIRNANTTLKILELFEKITSS